MLKWLKPCFNIKMIKPVFNDKVVKIASDHGAKGLKPAV